MKLKDIKALFEVAKIKLDKYKEDGTFVATLGKHPEQFSIYVTKATDTKTITDETPVTFINGKYYLGVVKEALESIEV